MWRSPRQIAQISQSESNPYSKQVSKKWSNNFQMKCRCKVVAMALVDSLIMICKIDSQLANNPLPFALCLSIFIVCTSSKRCSICAITLGSTMGCSIDTNVKWECNNGSQTQASASNKKATVESILQRLWYDIALALLNSSLNKCLLKLTQSTSRQLSHCQTTALWGYPHICVIVNLWFDATFIEVPDLQSIIYATNASDTVVTLIQNAFPLTPKRWVGSHDSLPIANHPPQNILNQLSNLV